MTKYPVKNIQQEQFEPLRKILEAEGFAFEDRAHQVFLARKGGIVANLYINGKVVLGGSDETAIERIISILDSLGSQEVKTKTKEQPPLEIAGTRIGTDEVGKGDYFGPLVVAGVLVTNETEPKLRTLGVRDSKSLSDTTVTNIAIRIRQVLGRKNVEEICISPLKYNILYQKFRNVNRILGWAHARAIENLLSNGQQCDKAVADQFGDERYIEEALMRKARTIKLVQIPKAERDISVATASILARDTFLQKLEDLGKSYLQEFPKGATHVIDFGKKLVETHGIGVLQNVAKLHFSTTKEITGGDVPKVRDGIETTVDLETVSREPSERELRDAGLEIFNLIDNFETEFRRFIKEKLSEHFGADWWGKGVDENIRRKCEGLQRHELAKGRKVELIDCLEFPHYALIITRGQNWKTIFSRIFKTPEKVLARLTVLKDWRDPVYHSRGHMGHQEKAEVVSSIAQLRRMTQIQTGLEEFGKKP